jgi:hypothetical protein
MGWEQAIKSKELLRLEKKKGDSKVIIEARKSEHGWDVFKTYVAPNSEGIAEEYNVKTVEEAMFLIDELKKEKELSIEEIKKLHSKRLKTIDLDMNRVYKEKNVEKWNFFVNKEKIENTIIIRFSGMTIVDVMLHNVYRYLEDKILDRLVHKLGLYEYDGLDLNIYFFTKGSNYEYDCADDLIANIELGFKNE